MSCTRDICTGGEIDRKDAFSGNQLRDAIHIADNRPTTGSIRVFETFEVYPVKIEFSKDSLLRYPMVSDTSPLNLGSPGLHHFTCSYKKRIARVFLTGSPHLRMHSKITSSIRFEGTYGSSVLILKGKAFTRLFSLQLAHSLGSIQRLDIRIHGPFKTGRRF